MTTRKEAVAFIIDASPSMKTLYPHNATSGSVIQKHKKSTTTASTSFTSTTTRFACAKTAIEQMISDLMLQSKNNETIVVVTNTFGTRHHLTCEEQVMEGKCPFPHVTELNGSGGGGGSDNVVGYYSGMMRPSVNLLKELRQVDIEEDDGDGDGDYDTTTTWWSCQDSANQTFFQKSKKQQNHHPKKLRRENQQMMGDFCDGLIVGADALHRRTAGKQYKRKLVLFTDAANEVNVDAEQMQTVVEGLRRMECCLIVIGLDFLNSVDFTQSQEVLHGSPPQEGEDEEGDKGDDDNSSEIMEESDTSEEEEESDPIHIKNENEKLLISIARITGGTVIAASTLQQIITSTQGKRIPKSSRRKMLLHVAPNLTVDAAFSLLLSRANMPTLKREAVLVDETTNKSLKDGMGEVMTSKITSATTHWDADNENVEVELCNRTTAFRYGADLIPMGGFDLEGLKIRSEVCMSILGYVSKTEIPRGLCMGCPYAVTTTATGVKDGDSSSRRSAALISSLSQAMHRLNQVALCTFVKSKDADPLIGALFPLVEHRQEDGEEVSPPRHLFFIQLPFAHDVSKFTMPPLIDISIHQQTQHTQTQDNLDKDPQHFHKQKQQAAAANDLIDFLMLPRDVLCSNTIPNPTIRCLNKTVMRRAIHPNHPIANVRQRTVIHNDDTSFASGAGGSNDDETNHDELSVVEDPMVTPLHVLRRAKLPIERFKTLFPLTNNEENINKNNGKGGGRKKNKRKFWSED